MENNDTRMKLIVKSRINFFKKKKKTDPFHVFGCPEKRFILLSELRMK